MGFIAGLIDVVDHLGRRLVKPNSLGNYQPVRLKLWPGASTTCVDRGDGTSELQIAAPSDVLSYATNAAFRAATPPADGTFFRVVSPAGEFRYSASSGAGWADDDNTILKPSSVLIGSNGRAYSTKASEHAATFAAARAMRGLIGHARHVHIESHTQRESAGTAADGGGGVFDVIDPDDYAYQDNNGTVLICADGAVLVRRDRNAGMVNAKWFGAAGDLHFTLTGAYINPASITGGTNDNDAIVAAAAYAGTVKKPLYIPPGVYLFDSTQLHFSRGLRVFGDKGRTVIVSRINKPFVIGALTEFCFEVGIKDIDILCYEEHSGDPEYWVAVDLYATTFSSLSFAARGWDYNLRSVHENADPYQDIRGENYSSLFDFQQMSYANGLPFPPPSGVICHIEGQVNDSTFRCSTANPTTASLILKGGVRGNLGTTITVENVTSDTCTNAVIIEDGASVNIRRVYAEGCTNAIAATNCQLIDITNVRGGDTIVTDCRGYSFGESLSRLVNVRSQAVNRGAGYGQAPKAVKTDNVGVLSLGHNYEPGLNGRHPTCHHSQLDGRNLFGNGDFSRWIGSVPWLWRNTPGYSPVFTKCGTGLADTTKSAGVPYCCKVFGATSGEFYVTPPLGDQYLGTTVSVSVKVKLDGGFAGLTVKGNNPASVDTTSGQRAVNEADDAWIECPDEAGDSNWRLITFSWVIDQGICDNGIALQMATNAACDIYLSELQVNFGVAVPRGYVYAREVLGGVVGVKRGGAIEIESATLPTITVDPITSQALVAGDKAVDTTGLTGGWRYNGAVWEPIRDSEASVLKARLIAATGGKLVRAMLGEDIPDSGTLNALPAFVGATCAATSTGRATLGGLRGRKAAIFAGSTNPHGYGFEANCAEYWAVARWDSTLPFASYVGLIGGAQTGGIGQRLIGSSGNSAMFEFGGTVEQDGVHTLTVTAGVSSIWRTYGTAGSDAREIGCSSTNTAGNWQGAIACALAFNSLLTAEESATVLALLKGYYSK